MTRQVPVQSPRRNCRQSTFKNIENVTAKEKRGVGEVAGGTTAECAAVFCCCPCTVINLLVVAVYKLPVGLCRKAAHKKKRRSTSKKRQRDGLLQQRSSDVASSENFGPVLEDRISTEIKMGEGSGEAAAAEKAEDGGVSETSDPEKEMLAQFKGTGFWRSSSRRELEAEFVVEIEQ